MIEIYDGEDVKWVIFGIIGRGLLVVIIYGMYVFVGEW